MTRKGPGGREEVARKVSIRVRICWRGWRRPVVFERRGEDGGRAAGGADGRWGWRMGGALGRTIREGVVGVALVAGPAARVGRGLGVREGDARGERDEREREDRAAGAIRPGDAREHRGRVEAKDATKPCLDVCGCAFAPRARPRFAPPLPSAKNNTSSPSPDGP